MTRGLAPGFRIGASFQARFSVDGAWLATLGKRITLWDVAQRKRLATGPAMSYASRVAFSPDGTRLVAKNTSGDALVMTLPDLSEQARFSGAPFGEGTDLLFSPDGHQLIDGTWSGILTVRDAATGKVDWQESGHDIFQLTATRDRSLWAYTRATGPGPSRLYLRRWPFDEQAEHIDDIQGVDALAISDDGKRLAVAGWGLRILERSPDGTWRLSAEAPELSGGGTGQSVSWSPDGGLLAYTGDEQGLVMDTELRELHDEPLEYASDADFAPTGDLVAFGDWSAGIVVAWPPGDDRGA